MTTSSACMPSRMSITDPAYARTLLLGVESMEAFADFRDSYFQHFQPASTLEQDHLEELIVCRWRVRRLWLSEAGLAGAQVVISKNAMPAAASPLEVLALSCSELMKTKLPQQLRRLENSLTRQARDAQRTIQELQAPRRAQAAAEAEAKRLAEEKARQLAEEAARSAEEQQPRSRPAQIESAEQPENEQLPPNQPPAPPSVLRPGKAA